MYQVLARTKRPKNFNEVIYQNSVIQILTNSLNAKRLHHSYLFVGSHGTGKTTIARILAKCFSCQNDISSNPCEICENCVSINNGTYYDLIEIDAASRTKVEDIRSILENIPYVSSQGRFKIYLVDEVHMLSINSFNALLKTLEEPPSHVKFLFATTDPQKLPTTVLSRCLRLDLHKIPTVYIAKYLEKILIEENIKYEKQAIYELSKIAKGSLRDALGLLEKAIMFCFNYKEIKQKNISDIFGSINEFYIFKIIENIVKNNSNEVFIIIEELSKTLQDFEIILDKLLEVLHRIAVIQTIENFNFNSEREFINVEYYENLAKLLTKEDTQLYYQIALIGKRDLLLAPTQKQGFEMIVIRMLVFKIGD